MTDDKLYRFESYHHNERAPSLYLSQFDIECETPKGYWAENKTFWVAKEGKKKKAYTDRQEAMVSFLKRKQAYVRHATNQLDRAKKELALAMDCMDNPLRYLPKYHVMFCDSRDELVVRKQDPLLGLEPLHPNVKGLWLELRMQGYGTERWL